MSGLLLELFEKPDSWIVSKMMEGLSGVPNARGAQSGEHAKPHTDQLDFAKHALVNAQIAAQHAMGYTSYEHMCMYVYMYILYIYIYAVCIYCRECIGHQRGEPLRHQALAAKQIGAACTLL